MSLRTTLKNRKEFINNDLWKIEMDGLSRIKRNLIHSVRIAVLTSRTFTAQKIGFQSVALAFFCTMAVVPFLSVALALTNGLGLSGIIEKALMENFPNTPDVVEHLIIYSDNILEKATSSVFGFFSAVFFVWLVIWMMLCVEQVFNNVWKVEKSRSFATRFWRDVAIVLISPFLMLVLYASGIFLTGILSISWVKWPLMTVASTLTFSAMYKFIPNTDVRYSNAFKAAIFSGILFTGIQAVYVGSQIFLYRLSGIYGAIAAIPFFMFWLNFSWYAILLGAELSYAFQHVHQYRSENYETAK